VENIRNEKERRELRNVVDQIKSDSGCVLILGPRIAVRAGDPDRRPLEDVLTDELAASLEETPLEAPASLRHAADLHFRRKQDRRDLQTSVRGLLRARGRVNDRIPLLPGAPAVQALH
jgi:hypothetical protein